MIYFIRHGQTEGNVRHIYTGNSNFPLTELGVNQAKETAKLLKDKHFDVIFCSPLLRAKQTMQEIAVFHKNTPIVIDNRLAERGDGQWEGLPLGDENAARWRVENWDNDYYGETMKSAYERVESFWDEIKSKYNGKNILVVAHVGIGRLSVCYFNGLPKDGDLNSIEIKNATAILLQK